MGVINCPKTMPPFGCSGIFKLFPRRVSFRETNLLESSRIFNGIGKSKSPLFLASLWLSALSVSHQPEAGVKVLPTSLDRSQSFMIPFVIIGLHPTNRTVVHLQEENRLLFQREMALDAVSSMCNWKQLFSLRMS